MWGCQEHFKVTLEKRPLENSCPTSIYKIFPSILKMQGVFMWFLCSAWRSAREPRKANKLSKMEQAIYKALQIIANKLTDMERKANRLKSEPSTRVSERNKRQQTSWQANKSSVAKTSKAWQTASTPSNVQQTSWLNYQVKSSISKQSRPSRTSEAKLASEQANQRK